MARMLIALLVLITLLLTSPLPAASSVHQVEFRAFLPSELRNGLARRPQLLGDRFEYWADDLNAQFYCVLPEPQGGLAGHRARITVTLDGSAAPLVGLTEPATTAKVVFLLETAALKPGKYVVAVALLNAQGEPVGEPLSYAFTRSQKTNPVVTVPAEGVPILVHEQQELPDGAWPARAGVPLPVGAVNDAARLALFEEGEQVPAQITPVATWGPRASIQWVHVHFLARYHNGKALDYRLKLLPAVAPEVKTTLSVEQSDDAFTVNTGVLKFTVGRKSFAGIESAWFDPSGQRAYGEEQLLVSGKGGPYVLDGRMIRFDALHDKNVSVELEENSPARIVIKATGWYVNPENRVPPLLKFVTRMTAYPGQATVWISQQTIITFDPRGHRIADLGFHIAAAGGERFAFGVDGQPLEGELPKPPATVFLHQDRYDHLRVVGAGKEAREGQRSDGWASLTLGEAEAPSPATLSVLLRDVWQKFPKELQLSRAGLTVHFWPAHGHRAFNHEDELDLTNIYKFWCFHQHRLLDLELPNDYFDRLQVYPGTTENVPQHAYAGSAQGTVISNDFALHFGTAANDDIARRARLLQDEPGARAPAAWNAASRAMGNLAAAETQRFGAMEEAVEKSFLSYTRSVERGNAYGMWNYADTHTYWNPRTNSASLHRVWLNSHYHSVGKTWLLYFRSGSRDLLRWARPSTDHYINIDTINYAPPDDSPEVKFKSHIPGAMYHCKGQTHWGAEAYGMQRRDGHAGLWGHWVDPDVSLWNWYMDANPRGWDVYSMWGQSLRDRGLLLRGTRREANTTLAVACTYYGATWDADALPAIHGLGLSLRTAEPLEKQNPGPFWHPLWINRYYGLTRDPEYVPFVLEHARRVGLADTWLTGLAGLAYELSGDKSYLTQHFDRIAETPRNMFHAAGDPYDWYGWGPGPLGSRWGFMGWPYFLAGVKAASIEAIELTNPSPGNYPYTPARPTYFNQPASLTVYALEPADRAFDLTITARSFGGDLHATSLVAYSPAGHELYRNERISERGSSVRKDIAIGADGETGLYRVEFRGHEAAVLTPVTSLPHEAVVIAKGRPFRAVRALGYVQPVNGQGPLTITIKSASDRDPCNVAVYDAQGRQITEASLFAPRPQNTLEVTIDPARHTLPIKIDSYGTAEISFSGEFDSLLYATTPESLRAVGEHLAKTK